MQKKSEAKRPKKRYQCKKCGRNTAVKHDNGRYRCLECHSIFGPNSRGTCYNKDEYLVLKTLLQFFELIALDERKNNKISLEKFTKMTKEQDVEGIKKLVEINIINRVNISEKLRILNTNTENILVITHDDKYRFQVYKNFLKPDIKHVFKNVTISSNKNDKYERDDIRRELCQKAKKLRLNIV